LGIFRNNFLRAISREILVKGKFHKDVPKDVIKEFKAIEYLLAHSYFYYPMLDIAFFKTTTVFEMAVRLRCQQLKIEIPNKKHTSLNTLLEKLAEVSHPSLPEDWKKVKYIRNHLAHPKQRSLLGITIINGVSQIVNVLNKLFLPVKFFDDLETQLNQLRKETKVLSSGLFVLEYNGSRYLIYGALPYISFTKSDKEISFWGFHPVLKDFPQTLNDLSIISPICLHLTDIMINNEELTATILHTEHQIKVYKTEKTENKEVYAKFIGQSKTAEPGVNKLYLEFIEEELSKGIVKFMYEEFWI
jgi:hypothetical protein